MATILVVGNQEEECDALALVMGFAGHRCETAGSLQEALHRLRDEPFDVVLADPTLEDRNSGEIVQALRTVSPRVSVMILSDDAPGQDDEVITHPSSPVRDLSPQFSHVGQEAAFLVLLPEQESSKFLTDIPQKAGLLNKLAVLYHSQQKYSLAERFYKQALKVSAKQPLYKRVLGADETQSKDAPSVASILNNLARLYHDQKYFEQAEPLYKRSLAIVEELFGPEHPKVVRRLTNLAELYRAQNMNDQAAEVDLRLKQIKQRSGH